LLAHRLQVELMYAKFQAGIWEALSKRYTDVDMAQVLLLLSVPFGGRYSPPALGVPRAEAGLCAPFVHV
jgi:hypothetical protein